MSYVNYHANQARIDDLVRAAGQRRRASEAGLRPQAQTLRRRQHGLGRLRRVLGGAHQRPATG